MKIYTLTIAGALASANAAVRGDAAHKLKKMQKLSNAVNKDAFRTRRMEAVDQETGSGVKPYKCVTATTYDGGTASFMSFTQSNGDGESVEYMTDIGSYISMLGQMRAQEKAYTCQYCEMDGLLDLCDDQFGDYNTAADLAAMEDGDFEAYLLELYQEDDDAVRAYYTYSKGGNTGAQSLIDLCYKCNRRCDNDGIQTYYETMVEDYAAGESSCVESNDGRYIGYTCGADGSSIELAMFRDDECTVMGYKQDAFKTAYRMYNGNNEEARMIGEMQMMTEMYSSGFSCQMGVDRSQDGGDEDADEDESEFCENLLAESISKDDCADGNYQYQGDGEGEEEDEEEDMNEYAYAADAAYTVARDGSVMIYSDDIEEVCGAVLTIEEALVEETYVNPYTGPDFSDMLERANSLSNGLFASARDLSSGAIIGITALVFATFAAVGFAMGKCTRTKSELEEPVLSGGTLT
uniref:Uncharacterized protein n=1 Tax=Skeletonema marinoi TaxID=267567 RepID=A0A7S2VHL8_9STRA|mmetsp:Transcript_8985/g.15292  ORF Transcript_8985/g.15292 Transcript_8985/m.15292 type:complete len:464 (+) Transcript_8985:34-1425(+)